MRSIIVGGLLSATGLVGLSGAAQAQQADTGQAASQRPAGDASANPASPQTASGFDDIVVTARRREESLQAVPISVTAVSGETLRSANVVSALDLPRIAPGLNNAPSGGTSRNLPLYALRGQQQGEFLAGTDPSVGIYFGDVIIQRAYGADQNIFDLAQVEVLKGPQGTLFGRNTTGGNIIFRPNLPTDVLGGGAFVQTGSFKLMNAEAYVNLPLAEGIALRIAASHRYQEGYLRNTAPNVVNNRIVTPDGIARAQLLTAPGATGERDQDTNGSGIRASLRIASGKFENVTVGTYLTSSTNGTGYKLLAIKPGSNAALYLGLAAPTELATVRALPRFDVRNDANSFADVGYSWALTNTTSFDLTDQIKLKNIIGYHRYSANTFEDMDGSAAQIQEFGAKPSGYELSNEFQIAGDMPGLNWIAGYYYYRETGRNVSISSELLGPFTKGTVTPLALHEQAINKSQSVFASATKTLDFISKDLSLTLGGRYSWDDRDIAFGTRSAIGLPGQRCAFDATVPGYTAYNARYDAANCTLSERTSFGKFTYTASLDWKVTPDALIYLVTRQGYRSGGFGSRGTTASAFAPFRPEVVRDVEGGLKADWKLGGDVRVRTNLAAYYQDYKDIQRLITFTPPATECGSPPGGICSAQTLVVNAASAHIYGGEAEISLRVGDWFELNGSAALVRPKYDSFDFRGVDYAKTASFGGVSRNQFGLNGRLTLPTPESFAKASVLFNTSWLSSSVTASDPTPAREAIIPAYSLTNLRFELNRLAGSNLSVGVGVNNVFDRRYLRSIFSLYNQVGYTSGIIGAPRQWTADLRFSF